MHKSRRSARLRFRTLDEVREHITGLQPANHEPLGKWSAAQNFFHLAAAFEGSIEGLPPGFPRIVRAFIRPFRWIVVHIRFPPFLPIPAAVLSKLGPPADADFEQQQARLLEAIASFGNLSDDPPPHPVLGQLTLSEALGFHLRHCEHHLNFIRLLDSH